MIKKTIQQDKLISQDIYSRIKISQN